MRSHSPVKDTPTEQNKTSQCKEDAPKGVLSDSELWAIYEESGKHIAERTEQAVLKKVLEYWEKHTKAILKYPVLMTDFLEGRTKA